MKNSQSAALFTAIVLALPAIPRICLAAPAPAQNGVPVIFWAHYMPQVPLCGMHNGTDEIPFVVEGGSNEEQAERTIEAALDSGINGFQMLCGVPDEFLVAAEEVRKRTGKTIYIAPEWCDQDGDTAKNANAIADYALKHDGDPCVAKVNGAQVHFFYGGVKWAEGDGLSKAREIFKQRGVKILFVPTIYCFDRQALDRTDLAHYRCWPAFQQAEPGKGGWLAGFPWEGATDFGTNWRTDVADALNNQLKSKASDFTFFPDIWPGYDSSNRDFQAIHCPTPGVAPLRDGLRIWTGLGYKQMSFITWNDMNETLLMPSSRNIHGYSEIINYYHQIAENGQSPFDSPKLVVAYQPESLIGDQAYFQCELLPEHNTASSDYIVTWRLEDQYGKTLATLGTRMTAGRENEDALAEVRLDTTPFAGKTEVMVPYVTVRQLDISSAASRVLYSNMRLAPVRLRYNYLRFVRPMVVALDRVAPDENITLAVQSRPGDVKHAHRLLEASASVAGPAKLTRLTLAESLLSDGVFRAGDTVGQTPAGQVRQNVRIDISAALKCRLAVDGGQIEERYTPYWVWDACRTEGPVDHMDYASQHQWGAPWNVFRIVARPDATITLTLNAGSAAKTIVTHLADVLAGNVIRSADIAGKTVVATFIATSDTTEPNIDYPLPPSGSYERQLPVSRYGEAVRVFHAYALTNDGKIAFSAPVVVDTAQAGARLAASVDAPFVQSNGTYDDFVNGSAEESRCPYTAGDIRMARLSADDVPAYHLAFDEGQGSAFNNAATGHQYGAGHLEGGFTWLPGGGVQLAHDAVAKLRSTSWPYGALTVRAVVHAPAPQPGAESQIELGPFTIRLNAGHISVAQRFAGLGSAGACAVKNGWNQIAVVYDLTRLRVFLNGEPVATSSVGSPVLQRTHWVPEIRIEAVAGKPALLDGGIKDVDVIGRPLTASEIAK